MFSKARLDTLSDGIFGVAMTLLILDVRLPDDFHPSLRIFRRRSGFMPAIRC
ncbi:TMEM175 family protein [Bradyrhizobium canariense]|uniref:TMEM175 family protein n=1 Tax=Bradyrhizobium canariense TaxID=255045 RepID=UPI000B03E39A|nr:TMEM175 family protein [Bradyrhizobium canariense]